MRTKTQNAESIARALLLLLFGREHHGSLVLTKVSEAGKRRHVRSDQQSRYLQSVVVAVSGVELHEIACEILGLHHSHRWPVGRWKRNAPGSSLAPRQKTRRALRGWCVHRSIVPFSWRKNPAPSTQPLTCMMPAAGRCSCLPACLRLPACSSISSVLCLPKISQWSKRLYRSLLPYHSSPSLSSKGLKGYHLAARN